MPRTLASLFRTPRQAATRHSRAAAAVNVEPLEIRRMLAVDLVSVADNSATAGAAESREPSVSANGRYVVFSTTSSNLVPPGVDTNGVSDVYLHDRTTGDTILISFASGNAAAGNGVSNEPSISADGRFVSFTSAANNLLPGADGNDKPDIFIRDWQSGTTVRASVDTNGAATNDFSAEPFTSADGNFVAYTSRATDITAPGIDRTDLTLRDVFLWNRQDNTTRMVSVTPAGVSGNNGSFDPSVSGDGRYVAFRSEASDIATSGADTNGQRDIYVRDMQTNVTTLVSRGINGAPADGQSDSPSISLDGNFIVFSSTASNLDPRDTNGAVRDVFVYDRAANTVSLISVNQARTGSGRLDSSEPTISQDGRFVAFTSDADDLVAGDTNGASDIFLYDIITGALNLVSATGGGTGAPGNGASRDAFVAPEAKYIAFSSVASDLASGDTNGVEDAFVVTAPDRTVDNTAPTATTAGVTQPETFIGDGTIKVAVAYSDETDLAPTSFGVDDVTITTPGGQTVSPTAFTSSGSGRSATVTYEIPAPGGTAQAADSGNYTVHVLSNTVFDAAGNPVAAATLAPAAVSVVNRTGPDLVASIPDTVPAAVGGGKGKVRVVVTNTGDPVPKKSRQQVALYLSQDDAFDTGDTQLAAQLKPFKGKPNVGKRYTLKFTWPDDRPAGTYHLIARADDTGLIDEARESNNTTSQPVTLAPPFVDYSGTVGVVPATAAAGQRLRVPVTITNNGNVPTTGPVTLRLVASTDAVLGAGDVEVLSLPKRLKIKPGASKVVPLSFTLPTTAGTGAKFFILEIVPDPTVTDSNPSNNTDASDTPVTLS